MRGREPWIVKLVSFIKGGKCPLSFDPEPLFEHLDRIEMAYCVGHRLVLPTLMRSQFEIKEVRFGMFPVMMSLN